MNFELYMDRIEKYLAGKLPDHEREAFEKEMNADAELRQTVALQRIADEVVELGVEKNLRRDIQQWAAEDAQKTAGAPEQQGRIVVFRRAWARWAAAACVVLLAGFFTWRWADGTYSDRALRAANYTLPQPSAMRLPGEIAHPLEPGFKALENGDFNRAESFFAAIPPDSSRYAEAQFYLGHAAVQLQHDDLAIKAFRNAALSADAKFSEKAEWNLALALLAAHRTSGDFELILAKMTADPNHSFHREATALRQNLDTFWRRLAK
jgi:hypothetical protein